jgi:hypothetical protein
LGLLLSSFSSAIAAKRVLVKRSDFKACGDPAVVSGKPALRVDNSLLKFTIASFDPNWFNGNASYQGPPLFTATISSAMLPYASRLALRVYVWVDTALGRTTNSSNRIVAFDRTTMPLDSSLIGHPLSSGEIFALPYRPGGVTFDSRSGLYNMIVEQHQVPEMNLHVSLSLLCNGAAVTDNSVTVTFESATSESETPIRHVHTVQAMSPGTDAANPSPVLIYTSNPVFQITSDLFNGSDFRYPDGEPRMEVFVYEVHSGQNPREVLNGMEYARFEVGKEYPVLYLAGQPPLIAGNVYVWRVRALLRGPESEYRYSNPLWFKVDPRLETGGDGEPAEVLSQPKTFPGQTRYGDDYVKRALAALKVILGSNYNALMPHGDWIPANGQIRLNGDPYSLEDLERLAREFGKSRHSLTRLNFR